MLGSSVGGMRLASCLMNASGCGCTTAEQLGELETVGLAGWLGAVVSKSATSQPRVGNPAPRFALDPHADASINSMGVPNLGLPFYCSYAQSRPDSKAPFIISLHPFSKEDLKAMLGCLPAAVRILEINLACPNLLQANHIGGVFGDENALRGVLGVIRDGLRAPTVVGLKLPPFYAPAEIDKVASVLLEFKETIRFICCCNSVANGLVIDHKKEEPMIHPKGGLGGVGGAPLKPVALANVRQFHQRIGQHIDIVGCGGVSTGRDAFEYILCGAKAVQIGTQLLEEGPQCFKRIAIELTVIMRAKKYASIKDFCGKLKAKPPVQSLPHNDPATALPSKL